MAVSLVFVDAEKRAATAVLQFLLVVATSAPPAFAARVGELLDQQLEAIVSSTFGVRRGLYSAGTYTSLFGDGDGAGDVIVCAGGGAQCE
jgi:hypothetical protein